MNEHPIVKPGQQWQSVRNGKTVTVIRVECSDEGFWAAKVRPASTNTGKWIGVGNEGIKGYRLRHEAL